MSKGIQDRWRDFFRSIMPAAWRAFRSSSSRKTNTRPRTIQKPDIADDCYNYRDSEPASIRKYLCTVKLKRSGYSFRTSDFSSSETILIWNLRRWTPLQSDWPAASALQTDGVRPRGATRKRVPMNSSRSTGANRLDRSCDPAPPRGSCDLGRALPKLQNLCSTYVQRIGLAKNELSLPYIHLLIARSGVRVNQAAEADSA